MMTKRNGSMLVEKQKRGERVKKWCLVVALGVVMMGCEPKKEGGQVSAPDAGATATAPKVDAGVVDAGAGAAVVEDVDAGDASEQPLKLELDRNLFPATKSGVLPNLRMNSDEPLKLQMRGLGSGSNSNVQQRDAR